MTIEGGYNRLSISNGSSTVMYSGNSIDRNGTMGEFNSGATPSKTTKIDPIQTLECKSRCETQNPPNSVITYPQIFTFFLAQTLAVVAGRSTRKQYIRSTGIFGYVWTDVVARVVVRPWSVKDGVRLYPNGRVTHWRFRIRIRLRLIHT